MKQTTPAEFRRSGRQCNETGAAISAMLVWALPGRSLALPLRHRVRAMPMPALGPAALVAAAVFWLGRESLGISDALLPLASTDQRPGMQLWSGC
jgi:hypothetical protein